MKILGIIPARMASSRFPGKPMKKIHGIPMIGHCYHRSIMSKSLEECYVATPDKEIFDYINSINGKVVMTSNKHEMCNERVFEAVDNIENLTNNNKFDVSLKTVNYTESMNLSVYNTLGQRLLYKKLENNGNGYNYKLDMSYVATGVYLVRVGNKENGRIKRIIVK